MSSYNVCREETNSSKTPREKQKCLFSVDCKEKKPRMQAVRRVGSC